MQRLVKHVHRRNHTTAAGERFERSSKTGVLCLYRVAVVTLNVSALLLESRAVEDP